MGVTHTVCNFDGRIIAALIPKDSENKNLKTMWIMASRSSRYINQDILQVIDVENDFPQYNLVCYYESSAGAVVYRSIKGKLRYLLIKNKRSANWGFPKGHLEMGETKYDAVKREVLEETGLHIRIQLGYEGISKYKLRNNVDKKVSIFVATTDDMRTIVQEEEIDDFMWLAYDQAIGFLSFENDKKADAKEVKRIHTINEQYEGKNYPGTNVEYKRVRIQYHGEKIEGVFPQFEGKDREVLPRKLYEASDDQQFSYCTRALAKKIERDPSLAKQFTPRQLEQIKNGEPRISGLTWHHTEHPGQMQLVDSDVHSKCRHTGGRSVWGGGSECR